MSMLVWLTLPFYDFCGFRSVTVDSVYKLQFFYIYLKITAVASGVVEGECGTRGNAIPLNILGDAVPQKMSGQGER